MGAGIKVSGFPKLGLPSFRGPHKDSSMLGLCWGALLNEISIWNVNQGPFVNYYTPFQRGLHMGSLRSPNFQIIVANQQLPPAKP